MTRQMPDMFSPSNFLLTNPTALAQTARSGGKNLLLGAKNWARAMLMMSSADSDVKRDS